MTTPATLPGTRLADACLARAQWQRTLFAPQPRRFDLLRLKPAWECRPLRLYVQRNQPFEFAASVLPPFLAYAGWSAEVLYSDYDDSLNAALDGSADAVLVWLDFERYRDRMQPDALAAWLADRLAQLRQRTGAPILVTDWPATDDTATCFNRGLRDATGRLPDVRICDQAAIAKALGDRYFDPRLAKVTGMALSDAACVLTARLLGLVWLPAVLAPRLRAVVLDLDHTLYAGVLGEDGVSGVQLTPEHVALHQQLLRLRAQGLFLAIVSRNEAEDVQRLLRERTDFPLRPEHFSASVVSWEPKPPGLRRVAQELRIGTDTLLFLDDNPGELANVAGEVPGVHLLHAADPAETTRALDLYPGLHGYALRQEDQLRTRDLAALAEREQLAQEAIDPNDYLRALDVQLRFAMNPTAHRGRLHELSVKTNQFNTNFLRLTEVQVDQRLADPACRAVTIALSDRLSDSGIVGAVCARREGDVLHVEELCISCRALGRQIEDVMVTEALRGILAELPASEVAFAYREGPRNGPARDWLARFSGTTPVTSPVRRCWEDVKKAALPVGIGWEKQA